MGYAFEGKAEASADAHRASSRSEGLFAEERQQLILERLQQEGKVTVEELAVLFHVSSPTIRTDLSRLEDRGLLQRTHGGAIAIPHVLQEPSYAERSVLHLAEKRAIAQAAAHRVREGETLLLDAGTTCYELALCLKEFRRLTVVTNSLAAAQVLAANSGIVTILIGGLVQLPPHATLGSLALRCLETIQCDRAFVTPDGLHLAAGFTVVDFDSAHIKREMLQRARQAIVLADASKMGQIAFAQVGPLSAADMLIVDSGIGVENRLALEKTGLQVVVAE